jgi:hypothetical protein
MIDEPSVLPRDGEEPPPSLSGPTWARQAYANGLLEATPSGRQEGAPTECAGVSLAWLRAFSCVLQNHMDMEGVDTGTVVRQAVLPAARHRRSRWELHLHASTVCTRSRDVHPPEGQLRVAKNLLKPLLGKTSWTVYKSAGQHRK